MGCTRAAPLASSTRTCGSAGSSGTPWSRKRLQLARQGQRLGDLDDLDRLGRIGLQHRLAWRVVVLDFRRLPGVEQAASETEASKGAVRDVRCASAELLGPVEGVDVDAERVLAQPLGVGRRLHDDGEDGAPALGRGERVVDVVALDPSDAESCCRKRGRRSRPRPRSGSCRPCRRDRWCGRSRSAPARRGR